MARIESRERKPRLLEMRRLRGLRSRRKQFLLLAKFAHSDFFGLLSYAETSRAGRDRCNRFLDPFR